MLVVHAFCCCVVATGAHPRCVCKLQGYQACRRAAARLTWHQLLRQVVCVTAVIVPHVARWASPGPGPVVWLVNTFCKAWLGRLVRPLAWLYTQYCTLSVPPVGASTPHVPPPFPRPPTRYVGRLVRCNDCVLQSMCLVCWRLHFSQASSCCVHFNSWFVWQGAHGSGWGFAGLADSAAVQLLPGVL